MTLAEVCPIAKTDDGHPKVKCIWLLNGQLEEIRLDPRCLRSEPEEA